MTLEIQEHKPMELVANRINPTDVPHYKDPNDPLNLLEAELIKYDGPECPVTHRFTPNLYTREIFIPKYSLLTSLLHLTTQPFFILQGDVSVWAHGIPAERYKAPYIGITKAGTRRLVYAHEDTIWAACFVTTLTDPVEITETLMCRDFNPHIDKDHPKLQVWRCNKEN
jgi:hypothetical protein